MKMIFQKIKVNYSNIRIPDIPTNEDELQKFVDKDGFKKFNYLQRRAFLFKLILQEGHPGVINQSSFARKFGVSQVQIHLDMKVLKKDIIEHCSNNIKLLTHTVFTKGINDLMKGNNSDIYKATKIMKDYNKTMMEKGEVVKIKSEITAAEEHFGTAGIQIKFEEPSNTKKVGEDKK